MAAYRYLVHDTRTGAYLDDLPLEGVRFGRRLNGAGQLTGAITLGRRTTAGASVDRILLDLVEPARCSLYVARDDVLVWGGIIWEHPDYSSADRRLSLAAAEHWSYFGRRRLRAEFDYAVPTEQLTIVRDLVNWAQAQPGGDIRVLVPTDTTTGVLRDPIYYAWERRVIGQIVGDMAGAEDGFDLAIDVTGAPGQPVLTLNMATTRGRSAQVTGLVFEPGKNLGNYRWPRSGTAMANSIDAVGAGEGDSMALHTATDTASIDAGYPLLDDVVAWKAIDDDTLLAAKAREVLAGRRRPVTTATLVNVLPGGDPPLGSWIMGDYARLRIEDDERFPAQASGAPGLDRYVRIIGDEVNVSGEGVETVNMTVEVQDG